ncbi:uncharacterized protein LOC129235328 isoform X2 [Uloborus diversus]|uniref:uncharacterized protein LOC129235328 isoform X2 n=1 Tax=Uloborus diversus TaxID=327109 RepID=UPI002409EF4B|nr:uncharacterized protein LOC129235328 isoform X2 [Uloborus diversus]
MMFSQLCRARPRTLWNKFAARQPATGELYSVSNCAQDITDVANSSEEIRCQLEHCTFCDYRFCCQVIQDSSGELPTELNSTSCEVKVTKNPAYGLSSKNWLEVASEDTDEYASEEDCKPSENDFELNENNKNLDSLNLKSDTTSQSEEDCDNNTIPMKMYPFNIPAQNSVPQSKTDCNSKHTEDPEHSNSESSVLSDAKHTTLTWSVLNHKQTSGEAFKNCDNKFPSHVIEHSKSDVLENDTQTNSSTKGIESSSPVKPKRSMKDRTFPLSLMKPIAKAGDKTAAALQQSFPQKNDLSRQGPVQKYSRERFQNATISKEFSKSKKHTYDSSNIKDPLSDIAKIKTEESIQEWLARIGEPNHSLWPEESIVERKREFLLHEDETWNSQKTGMSKTDSALKSHSCQHENSKVFPNPRSSDLSHEQAHSELAKQKSDSKDLSKNSYDMDASSLLSSASKASPANIPMVVMQCSRLHSHIGCKPPFQQTSLPMGTLVTALYQESDWLYVQTPHGVEGFVLASNCAPIGAVSDPVPTSRRPWEPCDFPIQINMHKRCEFGRQHESYIQAMLPTNNGKQAVPYVSTVKMKTNFYSDRYFSHTFKSKDSIKTAKTVTDILRNSPETKVSN